MATSSLTVIALIVLAVATTGVAQAAGPYLEAKLSAAEARPNDELGASVAAGRDHVIVGAPGSDVIDRGAAYVFVRSASAWRQQARLTPQVREDNQAFGRSVAMWSDELAVVGASREDGDRGAVYVFQRSGETWTQTARIVAPDPEPDAFFGEAVAVSRDTIVIGAPSEDTAAGFNGGAVYVFDRSGDGWVLNAKLTPPDGAAGNVFGRSVWTNGFTTVVGSPANGPAGAAYVFFRRSGGWNMTDKLTPPEGRTGEFFGASVDLENGIVVGAPTAPGGGTVYAFRLDVDDWVQKAEFKASDVEDGDGFGSSIANVSGRVIVGGLFSDTPLRENAGAAYLFDHHSYGQDAKLMAEDVEGVLHFGASVAGTAAAYPTVAVGAPLAAVETPEGVTTRAGAVYVYGLDDVQSPSLLTITASPGQWSGPTATFSFVARDARTGPTRMAYDCSLDGGAFEPCTPPMTYENLQAGSHAFRVRAKDLAGNLSDVVEHRWNVDVDPPTTVIDSGLLVLPGSRVTGRASDGHSGVSSTRVAFRNLLTGATRELTAECRAGCDTPGTASWEVPSQRIGPGTYSAVAWSEDRAGNVGPRSGPVTLIVVG